MCDAQYHTAETVQVVAPSLKIAFAAQSILYAAVIRLNAWIVGWNHTWVAFIVFVFSCVGKPNSLRRSLTYVSGIGTFRSYFWSGTSQIAESVNFKKVNYEFAIKIKDLYMNIYMYVFIYMCVRICLCSTYLPNVHVYVHCIYIYIYVYTYIHRYIYIYIYIYRYIYIYVCVCVCMCEHIHIYIYIYTLII